MYEHEHLQVLGFMPTGFFAPKNQLSHTHTHAMPDFSQSLSEPPDVVLMMIPSFQVWNP